MPGGGQLCPGRQLHIGGHCSGSSVCDSESKLCLADCGSLNIVSKSDLEANKYCRSVSGDLTLSTTFNEIDATALPYLQEVTGSIVSNTTALTSITLSSLRRVGGYLLKGASSYSGRLLSMPALETAGTPGLTGIHWAFGWGTEVNMPNLRTLDGGLSTSFALEMTTLRLPKLQAISGSLTIVAPKLTILDLSSLRSVGGDLAVMSLIRLPWSSFMPIFETTSASSKSAKDIGCCTPSTYMCTMGSQGC